MANLSNINNKLVVTTDGAALINQGTVDYGSAKLQVSGSGSTGTITWRNDGGRKTGYLYSDSAGVAIYSTALSKAGIYMADDVQIDFRVNGGIKMLINSSGNVGIGDDTPTSKLTILGTSTAASNTLSDAIVDIQGTSTAHLLMGVAAVSPFGAWINTDSTAQPLVLMGTGGNVGIGNSNPLYQLDISGAGANDGVIHVKNTTSNYYPRLAIQSDVKGYHIGVGGSGAAAGYANNLYFYDNTIAAVRMVIDTNGNVGIGTSSPTSPTSVTTFLAIEGTTAGIVLSDNGSADYKWDIWNSGGGLYMKYNDTTFGVCQLSNGNVGIGTTAPQTKLEVVGETLINSLGFKANRLNSGYNVAGDNADIWINYEGYLNGALYYRNFNIGDGRNGTVATFNGSTKISYFQGDVGIGTTAPSSYYADKFVVYDGDEGGMTIANSSTTGKSYLAFADGTVGAAAYTGYIAYDHNDNSLSFANDGGSNRLTIATGGNATFAGDIILNPGNSNKIILTPDLTSHYIQANGYWIDVIGNAYEVFRVFGGTGGTSEYLRVAGNGAIGIGTTSPQGKLDSVAPVADLTDFGRATGSALNIRIANVVGHLGQINFCNDAAPAFGYGSIGMVMTSGSGVGLGDMVFGTKSSGSAVVSTQRARITSGGNFIIGTEASTSCTLKVSSTKNGSESDPHFCLTGNGYSALHWLDTVGYFIVSNSVGRDIRIAANTNGVKLTPGATSWVSNSDISLKENLKPLNNVLDKIKDYRCIEYNLKNTPEDKKIGFIAQDWENDFAPIVNKDNEGLLGMKYTETIPVLLKAIQELKAEIELLKNK